MPFLIVKSQETLSKLLAAYKQVREDDLVRIANPQNTENIRSMERGYTYVLENTILELGEALAEDAEDRQAYVESLADFWERVLHEWVSEESQEYYQLGKIKMLSTVLANLKDLQSYD